MSFDYDALVRMFPGAEHQEMRDKLQELYKEGRLNGIVCSNPGSKEEMLKKLKMYLEDK